MTDHNHLRSIRTVSEGLDILGRYPEGIPDVPDDIIEAFADEYEQPATPEIKLGHQALELTQNNGRDAA